MLLPKKHLSAKNFIFSARTLSHRNLTAAVFGKDEKVETIYRCSLRLAGGDEVVVEFGGAKEGKPRSRDELVAKNRRMASTLSSVVHKNNNVECGGFSLSLCSSCVTDDACPKLRQANTMATMATRTS
jgi:hypothetical protein